MKIALAMRVVADGGRGQRPRLQGAVAMLLLAAGLAGAAPASPPRLEQFPIGGRAYVRLSDWARLKGLQVQAVSRQEMRLGNDRARLVFTANSQKAVVNGVNVHLSAPASIQNGVGYVALVDVQATLQPLLWPVPKAGARARLVCLDPGHGGKDTGNLEGKKREKDYTLALARELSAQLRKAGFKVVLTRSWDTTLELDDRSEIARRRGADLFLSLHFNAAAGTDARGAEVYCLTPPHTASTNARGEGAGTGALPGNHWNDENVQLAYQVQRALVGRLGLEDRGVRRARWAVLRNARMPAVLVEGGFMSHPAEAGRIYSPAWQRQLAEAIVEGVKNYRRFMAPAA